MPELIKLPLRTIPLSVPNFIILIPTVHKAAIDNIWGGIIITSLVTTRSVLGPEEKQELKTVILGSSTKHAEQF